MEFDVAGVDIGDACAERIREVEKHFAPLSRPPRVQLMVDAADLAFEDPELAATVRGRLDAAGGSEPPRRSDSFEGPP